MVQDMEVSIDTPDDKLQQLVGSQILRIEVNDFVMSPSIHHKVTRCSVRGNSIVILLNDGESIISFTEPIRISYYPEGNLR